MAQEGGADALPLGLGMDAEHRQIAVRPAGMSALQGSEVAQERHGAPGAEGPQAGDAETHFVQGRSGPGAGGLPLQQAARIGAGAPGGEEDLAPAPPVVAQVGAKEGAAAGGRIVEAARDVEGDRVTGERLDEDPDDGVVIASGGGADGDGIRLGHAGAYQS